MIGMNESGNVSVSQSTESYNRNSYLYSIGSVLTISTPVNCSKLALKISLLCTCVVAPEHNALASRSLQMSCGETSTPIDLPIDGGCHVGPS